MKPIKLGAFERGRLLLCGALALALAGCLADTDRDNVSTGGGGGGGEGGYYYDTDIQPLFTDNCNGCHGSTPANGASHSFTSYDNIVDVTVKNLGAYQPSGTYKYIDTTKGSSDSYIWMKVTGASGIGGGQMNYLTPDEVQILADWVDQDPPAPESP